MPQTSSSTVATETEERVSSPRQVPLPRLVLRGERRTGPRVNWTEDTIDNEFLDRKKSKVCCIYHPPREFGESSESESDSSSDSDSNSDSGPHNYDPRNHTTRGKPNRYERQPKGRKHGHSHGRSHGHSHGHSHDSSHDCNHAAGPGIST